MGIREKAQDTWQKHEDGRVYDFDVGEQGKKVRDALKSWFQVEPDTWASPTDAKVAVDRYWRYTGVVVTGLRRLYDPSSEDGSEPPVQLFARPTEEEQPNIYLIGVCSQCGSPTPLDPPLVGPEDSYLVLGKADAMQEPVAAHACPPASDDSPSEPWVAVE